MSLIERRRTQFDLSEKDIQNWSDSAKAWVDINNLYNLWEYEDFMGRRYNRSRWIQASPEDGERRYIGCGDTLSSAARNVWANRLASALSYF